ncbi:CELL WALL INTEGRITY/STRESS RESPONSE COMPONENT-LIKE PROTEIN [Salix purpurea]|uniref:CELL WALL INTEGRITY/STRESS RESPONSE COMPONENT-LIKE PROTEIN n=1 Tax=Salix purpurea TaxID=77065 RepID=A0A9Q0V4A5_SALPP|nr:CELL WALL INTEGRITY/STRESS RESPONSE COMPONENT-LIKE PROTEIN [Salix purpurea]
MAPLKYSICFSRQAQLLLFLVLFMFVFLLHCASSDSDQTQLEAKQFLVRRRMLEVETYGEDQVNKKKSTNLSTKNQTKLAKPSLSAKNQTKLVKTSSMSTKNQTKITKSTNSTKATPTPPKSISQLKKLNSTSKAATNSASTKKSSDLLKLGSSTNKTTKPTSTKQTQSLVDKKVGDSTGSQKQTKTTQNKNEPSWVGQDNDDDDLVAEFRDLPSKFHQTILPDLERLSITSKKYLTKANKDLTKGFKPIVGNTYAPTIASAVSFAFILIPLLLVSLIFNRIKAYFSLQKILIFIQVYLSIYFTILCLSSLVTGLEPLKFFYATSQSTYVCLMVFQTLGYVLYLLLLLMYLILVFSAECGLSSKLLGLGQTLVGFAIGLHCYVAVFHRVVLHQPPKTNWKIHGIYATCFLVICLFANAERRKKAYLEEGGEEGKKN